MAIANRSAVVESIIKYLKGRQWQDVIQMVQERDMNHLHSFITTSVNPRDLAKVFVGYMKQLGWSFYRDVDYIRYKDGGLALYGFYPKDRPSFEIYCKLKSDVILEPTHPVNGESGSNVRVWTDAHIRRHVNQYEWRPHKDSEVAEVRKFFSTGDHWKAARELILEPDVVHVHCNVETSIHPNVIRGIVLDDIKNRGWEVEHCHHCVFNAKGTDQGKIIFYGLKPDRTFDVVWYYNPDVVIQVNTQETNMDGDQSSGNPFFVMRSSAAEAIIKKFDFVSLDDKEIAQIIERCATFDQRSVFSWRMVPAERVLL